MTFLNRFRRIDARSYRLTFWMGLLSLGITMILGCDSAPSWTSSTGNNATKASSVRHTTTSTAVTKAEDGPEAAAPWMNELPLLEDSIVIGLDADMTSASARSGEAIRRGVLLAIDEINSQGGVLGRPLQMVARDHRGNPARGIDNIGELAQIQNLVAVVGGLHTPVALEELETIHQQGVIYLSPWAAGTPLVSNGRSPNFVFRVSVRDEYAGEFLVNVAMERGKTKIGLLLERTGWGRSNHEAMKKAIADRGLSPASVQWFNWSEPSLQSQLNELLAAGSDAVLLVANPLEGVLAVEAMAKLPQSRRVPIISHWGITGGNFAELAHESLPKVDLSFLQTYSFIEPPMPDRSAALLARYCRMFDECSQARDVKAPAGTAHAYELVRMLAAAIETAGSTDRALVRDALETLPSFDGLIRNYRPPFTAEMHDALTIDDFHMARYDDQNVIVLSDPLTADRENE